MYDYSWIRNRHDSESFLAACAHFEEGLRKTGAPFDLLRAAVQAIFGIRPDTLGNLPKPADILAIKWEDVLIVKKEDLIGHLRAIFDVDRIGPVADYIDWDRLLQGLAMVGDHKSFNYDGFTYYARGL